MSSRLDAAGVATTGQLLDACRDPLRRKQLAAATGLSDAQLQGWLVLLDPDHGSEFARRVSGKLTERGFKVVDRH